MRVLVGVSVSLQTEACRGTKAAHLRERCVLSEHMVVHMSSVPV
jgi:hypothetical protein